METITHPDQREYRKTLTNTGLIYLGYIEHEIRVLNVSLHGFLAEIKYDDQINNIKDIFEAFHGSSLIDFYLPGMGLAGEAEVVRVSEIENGFQIGLEFRRLSHELQNKLYSRKAYRKNMTATGHIVLDDRNYTFNTLNVSVYGLMINIFSAPEIKTGLVTWFELRGLDLQGEAQVVWVSPDGDATLLGLQYLHMEREQIKGIPKFLHQQ